MTAREIKAEISGKVWKIETKPGARLAAEDPIVILESMKMEIPVAAPMACRVTEILVAEGDTISEGQVIARVEP